MRTVFITGANRGIGLAFARHYVLRGDTVFAGCFMSDSASALLALHDQHPQRCYLIPIDVADDASMQAAVAQIAGLSPHLDVLINNAGMVAANEQNLATLDPAVALTVYRVNALAPLLLTQACHELLTAAPNPVVACLTSRTGALREGMSGGGGFSYSMTKAALHRAIPTLAGNLRADGIIAVGLDPGFVETDMTRGFAGNRKQITPETSVAGMVAVLDRVTLDDSGLLLRWNGARCRWYGPKETADELQIEE